MIDLDSAASSRLIKRILPLFYDLLKANFLDHPDHFMSGTSDDLRKFNHKRFFPEESNIPVRLSRRLTAAYGVCFSREGAEKLKNVEAK